MSTRRIKIALCALAGREERLLKVALGRLGDEAVRFEAVLADQAAQAQIAIVDVASERSMRLLGRLREARPALPAICISDDGQGGSSRYRLSRTGLLVGLQGLLASVVADGLPAAAPAPRAGSPAPEVPGSRLPWSTEPVPRTGPRPAAPLNALVADAEEAIRNALADALRRCGIGTTAAVSAPRVLSLVTNGNFDLVLLDAAMAGTDGYELCRQIKRDPYTRSLPVVLLSSRLSPFDRSKAALAGCDGYLVKPPSESAVHAVAEAVLLKRSADGIGGLIKRGFRTAALR
ncbi:MAG: response regulator [Xanthomonadales bacterium]|nr:response regulator [Xanthomonadales bacterium]